MCHLANAMHSTGTGQPVETQDVFFWCLAGWSAPTGLAILCFWLLSPILLLLEVLNVLGGHRK